MALIVPGSISLIHIKCKRKCFLLESPLLVLRFILVRPTSVRSPPSPIPVALWAGCPGGPGCDTCSILESGSLVGPHPSHTSRGGYTTQITKIRENEY